MTLTGPDVSHHQGAVNWQSVRGAGHTFGFAKATEGTSFVSSTYQVNENGMKAAGLIPGAYHFLQPGNAAAQCDHFLDVVGGVDGMLCTVDVETTSSGAHPSSADAHAFADRFHSRTGGHPLILYTGRWYWKDILGNPHGADIGPLWHSAYSSSPGVLYGGWAKFTFWQWTSSGNCPGVSGACDLNYFYGTVADLEDLTLVPAPPEPSGHVQEDDMFLFHGPGTPMYFCANGQSVGLNESSDVATFTSQGVPVFALDDDTYAKFRERFPGS